MSEYRAPRQWHIAERYGYFYAENQFGGFVRYSTADGATAAIERDIAAYPGDQWAVSGRLEYLRSQLRAECISYGELCELQSLAEHIDPGDVELLEAAGVPEFG